MHNGGTASDTVVNSDGWQIVKEGGLADFTTVNQKGKLQVNAGGTATNVTLKQGGALVTSTAATVLGSNRLGNFTVENGKADGVVLESGGRLDILESHSAQNTLVDDGGMRTFPPSPYWKACSGKAFSHSSPARPVCATRAAGDTQNTCCVCGGPER